MKELRWFSRGTFVYWVDEALELRQTSEKIILGTFECDVSACADAESHQIYSSFLTQKSGRSHGSINKYVATLYCEINVLVIWTTHFLFATIATWKVQWAFSSRLFIIRAHEKLVCLRILFIFNCAIEPVPCSSEDEDKSLTHEHFNNNDSTTLRSRHGFAVIRSFFVIIFCELLLASRRIKLHENIAQHNSYNEHITKFLTRNTYIYRTT